MCNAIEDIEDVQNCHFLYSSSEVGLSEEEKQKMQRNYEKIRDTIWGVIFPQMKSEVRISYKKLKGYYSNEITDYENKDDEYKRKSETIRLQYSSPWELYNQRAIDVLEATWKILKGAVMAVVEILKGLYSIGNVIYYSASGGAAAIAYLTCPETPAWADDALGESEDYFGKIADALSHPVETVESMAQSTSDTYEKEGLTYMVSYAVTDLLLGKALSGAGKADEITDVAGMANKADDVAELGDAVGDGSRYIDDIKRIDEIEVEFNYNSNFDEAEFSRQLAEQQKGMNELSVQEYLDNRQKYLDQGRALESNAAQQAARKEALADKITELRNQGMSYSEAKTKAQDWLDTQAALHNPDQVAGGNVDNIGGLGDKKVNSSIGSQWRYRIDEVDKQVKNATKNMSDIEKKTTKMNVKLKYKG